MLNFATNNQRKNGYFHYHLMEANYARLAALELTNSDKVC
jgi:hypothetical protein